MKATIPQVVMWLRSRFDREGIEDDKIAADFIESRLQASASYTLSLACERTFMMSFPKNLSDDERADILELLELVKRQLSREGNEST